MQHLIYGCMLSLWSSTISTYRHLETEGILKDVWIFLNMWQEWHFYRTLFWRKSVFTLPKDLCFNFTSATAVDRSLFFVWIKFYAFLKTLCLSGKHSLFVLIDPVQLQGLSVVLRDSCTYIIPYDTLLLTNKQISFQNVHLLPTWYYSTFEVHLLPHYHFNYQF